MNNSTLAWNEIAMDCVRYWERKRILYNLVLAFLVIVCWSSEIVALALRAPAAILMLALILVVFAAIANVLYCAAYPVDFAMQLTPLRAIWLRARWLLFALGLILASAMALWVMLSDGMG